MAARRPSWSLVVAIIAMLVSVTALWQSHLDPADLSIMHGAEVAFGYIPDGSGRLQVIVPVVLSNAGARTGVVSSMGLVLIDPQRTDGGAFSLRQVGYSRYQDDVINRRADAAVPVPVHGHSTEMKYTLFSSGEGLAGWVPEPRSYELATLCWTGADGAPSIGRSFHVTFSWEDCVFLQALLEKRRGLVTWIQVDEMGKWKARQLSMADLESLREVSE